MNNAVNAPWSYSTLALKAPCFMDTATGQIFLLQKKWHYLSMCNPTPAKRCVCLSVGEYLKEFGCERGGGSGSSYSVPVAAMAISSTAYELEPCDRLLNKLVGHRAKGNPQLLIIAHMIHTWNMLQECIWVMWRLRVNKALQRNCSSCEEGNLGDNSKRISNWKAWHCGKIRGKRCWFHVNSTQTKLKYAQT